MGGMAGLPPSRSASAHSQEADAAIVKTCSTRLDDEYESQHDAYFCRRETARRSILFSDIVTHKLMQTLVKLSLYGLLGLPL